MLRYPFALRRRSPVALLGVGVAALLVIGCSGATLSPAPTTTPSVPVASPTLQPTPLDSPSASTPTQQPSPPSQTDTAWGRIWDSLPPGFPAYTGVQPTQTRGGAASATLDAGTADPATVLNFYRSALEGAGYSTVASTGPLEDGSRQLDTAGAGGCKIQTTVAPLGATTIVTILYGAGCPFS